MGTESTAELAITHIHKATPDERLPATPEEAICAYLNLSKVEKGLIDIAARGFTNDGIFNGQENDLINETITRIMAGSRKWYFNNGEGEIFTKFFCGAMKSIIYEWRREYIEKNPVTEMYQKKRDMVSLEEGAETEYFTLTNDVLTRMETEEIIQATFDYFRDDKDAKELLMAKMLGYNRKEIIEKIMKIDLKTYETITRRLTRHLGRLENHFWGYRRFSHLK